MESEKILLDDDEIKFVNACLSKKGEIDILTNNIICKLGTQTFTKQRNFWLGK